MNRWKIVTPQFTMCALAVSLLVPAAHGFAAPANGGKSKKDVSKLLWETNPALEELYTDYKPSFTRDYRGKLSGIDMKFSRQKSYMNMADVKMDSQVWPIIKKANATVTEKKEHRRATELYRRIMKEYPDDLVQIAEQGVFVPATLYVQRKILRYPKKELTYYRILYDPAAKEIYDRAVKRYSIFDYKDLVKMHLATSYGDDALFALGNDAVDKGKYKEARRAYERIVTYHGLKDEDKDHVKLNRDQVWVRLAICYRHLGMEKEYQAAVAKIGNRNEKTVSELLKQLEGFKYDAFAVRQRENRRSGKYDSLDDRRLSDPMPYSLPANTGEWKAKLAPSLRRRWDEPEPLPWATDTDLIYKDRNVLYSRSLITGEPNWIFGPGGSSRDWDFYGGSQQHTNYYPHQSILIHDGTVLANMFVYGPSLVAVDQYTGRLLWAKGPMAARTEDEWLDRYQASPAAGRGFVVAPVVHDDIRGQTHIASTAELAAYETRTGKLLWRTWLSRISPLKLTQSRYPRKIRILSSSPLVKEGVVYHVTNAGIVAALDAQTGDIRWLTRYPQTQKVMDNFSNPGLCWRNETPLIRGDKLYVTPVDSEHLLCLDTETGRILWVTTGTRDSGWPDSRRDGWFLQTWGMAGFTPKGRLTLFGEDLVFLDAETGKREGHYLASAGKWVVKAGYHHKPGPGKRPKGLEVGITGEGEDYVWPLGEVHARPTISRDGKIYFSMQAYTHGGPFNSDLVLDLKERGLIDQRRWYSPEWFILDNNAALPVAKRVVNEEPEAFEPSARMTFTRWDVPFEVDITHKDIVVRYDRKELNAVLAKRKDLDTLFGKAEIARMKEDVQGAINMYEECKPLLPSEEEDRRRSINLRLYPLYTELARWGHQSTDWAFLEDACRRMGSTASNPMQEIRALLAYAELHERKGDWMKAIRVLQNASRHYWTEPLGASGFELGDREALMGKAKESMKNLLGQIPPLYADVGAQIAEWEEAALDGYFLSVAAVDREYVVEARSCVAQRLQRLLEKLPDEARKQYRKEAEADLAKYDQAEVGERLLWCWPSTDVARRKMRAMADKLKKLPPVERRARLWRLDDLASACGLGENVVPGGKEGLTRAKPPALPSGAGFGEAEAKNEDPDMVRLALPQRGAPTEETAGLLFVGGRKKRAFGNRYNLLCRDMKADKKLWETPGILLHKKEGTEEGSGQGYEVGFEEVFIWNDLAIVHGQYDVIAVNRTPGQELFEQEGSRHGKKKTRWHFRVPLGFVIRKVDMCGEVIILCGRGSTMALSAVNGQIVWDAREAGEFYAGPFFHRNIVLTVRKSPAEVSFRRIGSGRLLRRVSLPGLTTNREHPLFAGEGSEGNLAAAEAAEAPPVACAEGLLVVNDGLTYHLVDVEKQKIRWSRGATKLDTSRDAAYRMWIDGGKIFVLKQYYAVLENAVLDAATGNIIWRRREGGKKQDATVRQFEKERGEEEDPGAKAATGLVLGSMEFVDGIAYGVKYEMGATTVTLVGMDPKSGNEVMRIREKGYEAPEAYVEPSWSSGCVNVRIQDGNEFEVWQVDVKAKKLVQKTRLEGYGRLGEYGDASAVWQGPYQVVWAFDKRKLTKP